VTSLMRDVAVDRPVFHSEADFQHALAWRIHIARPDAKVRLEVPAFETSRDRLDVRVDLPEGRIPIEVKYWQAPLSWVAADGETFRLINQSAQDMHRAAFTKDVMRIELLVVQDAAVQGWVVALTNDPSYWNPGRDSASSDAAFRLHEGRELGGRLAWRTGTSINTMKGTEAIALRGIYRAAWHDYSTVDAPRGRFRFLAVRVVPDDDRNSANVLGA
jgi:hypothetical protein